MKIQLQNCKTLVLLVFLCFHVVLLFGQTCVSSSSQSISLRSQEEVDNFAINYDGCTVIEGDLDVWGGPSPITNLNGLSHLTKVNGRFSINATDITSLEGLESLDTISSLSISDNNALLSLESLSSVIVILNSLWVTRNDNLINLIGLEGVSKLRGLHIRFNQNLVSLEGLEGLTSVGDNANQINCDFVENPVLTNLDGFQNYTDKGQFQINGNLSLTNLNGLNNVDPCASYFNIFNNPQLAVCNNDFICENLLKGYNWGYSIGNKIENNAPGCNSPEEVEASCGELAEYTEIDTIIYFCEGSPYEYEGSVYTTDTLICSNIQTGVGIGGYQCYETTCTQLIANPTYDTTFYQTICEGDSYLFNDIEFMRDTSLCLNYNTFAGCDSIICLELTVLADIQTSEMVYVCPEDPILEDLNPDNLSVAETNPTVSGCDSTHTTQYVVAETYETNQAESICDGNIFTFDGVDYSRDTSFCETYSTIYGCDSIVCFSLVVVDSVLVEQTVEICEGETYDFDEMALSSDTTVCVAYQTVNGCDSTFCLTINVSDTIQTQEQVMLCEGDEFIYQGQSTSTDATLCATSVGMNGCDSTHCVTVVFQNTIQLEETAVICPGETYNFEGLELSTDTLICRNGISVNGCDSMYCFNLSLSNPVQVSETNSICQNETLIWNGNEYTNDTLICATFVAEDGCDSIHCIELSVLDTIVVQQQETICAGTSYDFDGHFLTTDTTLCILYTSNSGCDSLHCVTVEMAGDGHFMPIFTVLPPSCYGEMDGMISIEVDGTAAPYTYQLNNVTQSAKTFTDLVAGTYELVVTDANLCTWGETVVLEEPEEMLLTFSPEVLETQLGDSLMLQAYHNSTSMIELAQWSPSVGLACDTCMVTAAKVLETTLYQLELIDEQGCAASGELMVRVKNDQLVYIPNAFSPNADGFNDLLTVYAGTGVEKINAFKIFNRWGKEVFSRTYFNPNDENVSWNGQNGIQPEATGIYIYFAEILYVNGRTEVFKGEVVLTR